MNETRSPWNVAAVAESDRVELDVVVRGLGYRAPSGDFAVLRVALSEKSEPFSAVGPLVGAEPGEFLRVQGRWVLDPRYGKQLKVDGWLPAIPATKDGLERFLGSGAVDGVGKEIAQRVVARFGLDTLDVLDHHPHRLTEVDGIGAKRARRIVAAWAEQRDARALMVLLRGHGLGTAIAGRISRHFGDRAFEVCRKDPYRLALEVPGVGFATADGLARAAGLDRKDPARLSAGAHHMLAEAVEAGHVRLPVSTLCERTADRLEVGPEEVEAALPRLEEERRLVRPAEDRQHAYLPKLFVAERFASKAVAERLRRTPPRLAVDIHRVLEDHESKEGITLAGQQRTAVEAATGSGFVVITGGPGTGKTTLVKALLAVFAAAKQKVQLAAPTGRAAKRLEEATGQAASTLHRLLEVNPVTGRFSRDRSAPVEADLVVVDEVSMVDLPLFASLLEGLSPATRLVLVGDNHQLPSVGPGRVLADLLDAGVPQVRLDVVFRQAEASLIVQNAYRIDQGERFIPSPSGRDGDFYVIGRDRPELAMETVLEVVCHRIPSRFGLDPRADVQVLTPMHKGPLGAHRLNEALQARLNPGEGGLARGGQTFRPGDKVMQTRNDYELGVLNGELGQIESVDARGGRLTVRFDGELVAYERKDLEHLSLAYACSVHKAQGSEYPAVVLALADHHAVMLDRRLVYTGVTRAKRLLVIIASSRALAFARRAPREGERGSGLAELVRRGE